MVIFSWLDMYKWTNQNLNFPAKNIENFSKWLIKINKKLL